MFNKFLAVAFFLAFIATSLMYANMAKAKGVVEKGLIGYWSFDSIVDEKVLDDFGDNDAIIKGDKKIVEGKIDEALEFDGDSDYVESTKEIPITGEAPRTLSVWVKFKSFPDNKIQVAVGWGEMNQGKLFAIASYHPGPPGNTSNYIGLWGCSNDHKAVEKPLDTDTWYHVTAIYEGGDDRKVYIDGNLEELSAVIEAGPFNTGTSKLVIGKKIGDLADRAWFDGTVDEVAIYDRALSEDEVEQNFLATERYAVESAKKLSITWGEIKVSRLID